MNELSTAFACAAIASLVPSVAAAGPAGSFTPGHLYRIYNDGLVIESNLDLDEVSRFYVPEIDGVSGASFNDSGELAFIGRHKNQVKVVKINGTGEVVGEHVIGGPLLKGSYIDFDPISRRYAFADSKRVTLLDESLDPLETGSTGDMFDRVSGVEFAPDGRLFAVDRFRSSVYEINSEGTIVDSYFIWRRPGGMDAGPNGELFITQTDDGILNELDLSTRTFETLVDAPGYHMADVLRLPDGTLIVGDNVNRIRRYTTTGVLLDFDNGPQHTFGEGLVYYVPSPGAVAAFGALSLLLPVGRRRS